MSSIAWNPNLKLILSDVDETVADLYVPAVPEMIAYLTALLQEDRAIFFITGQGLQSVLTRIVHQIPQPLRKNILIAPCNGVEVFGHDATGTLIEQPFYSVYEEKMNDQQRQQWREIVQQLIAEFKLKTVDTMPVREFKKQFGDDPLTVMYEDRGPQITFEVVNGYDLQPAKIEQLEVAVPQTHGVYDLRIPMLERADELLKAAHIPISPRLAGAFALDFVVQGVSKTTAIEQMLANDEIMKLLHLTKQDLSDPQSLEVWGDKFSTIRGGSDRFMSLAVSPQVRSIDFRPENPEEFEPGYNIVLWDGEKHLHEGLLEYLQSR
jgi:hydroxymethylpyrimidine pyrophosphatase-like HAD family hydrolase